MNNTWLCSCGRGLRYSKRRVTEEGVERFYLCTSCNLVWCSVEKMQWSYQREELLNYPHGNPKLGHNTHHRSTKGSTKQQPKQQQTQEKTS